MVNLPFDLFRKLARAQVSKAHARAVPLGFLLCITFKREISVASLLFDLLRLSWNHARTVRLGTSSLAAENVIQTIRSGPRQDSKDGGFLDATGLSAGAFVEREGRRPFSVARRSPRFGRRDRESPASFPADERSGSAALSSSFDVRLEARSRSRSEGRCAARPYPTGKSNGTSSPPTIPPRFFDDDAGASASASSSSSSSSASANGSARIVAPPRRRALPPPPSPKSSRRARRVPSASSSPGRSGIPWGDELFAMGDRGDRTSAADGTPGGEGPGRGPMRTSSSTLRPTSSAGLGPRPRRAGGRWSSSKARPERGEPRPPSGGGGGGPPRSRSAGGRGKAASAGMRTSSSSAGSGPPSEEGPSAPRPNRDEGGEGLGAPRLAAETSSSSASSAPSPGVPGATSDEGGGTTRRSPSNDPSSPPASPPRPSPPFFFSGSGDARTSARRASASRSASTESGTPAASSSSSSPSSSAALADGGRGDASRAALAAVDGGVPSEGSVASTNGSIPSSSSSSSSFSTPRSESMCPDPTLFGASERERPSSSSSCFSLPCEETTGPLTTSTIGSPLPGRADPSRATANGSSSSTSSALLGLAIDPSRSRSCLSRSSPSTPSNRSYCTPCTPRRAPFDKALSADASPFPSPSEPASRTSRSSRTHSHVSSAST
ncbi:hypothetical protein ACHAWF_016099 [Thalassiosira exigua]